MIARTGPRVEQLPPLRLYREDLDKLVSLFKEHCQHVNFGDEEHTLESLEEMESQSPASLRCFMIQGADNFLPRAELVIRGSHATRLAVQRSTLWVVERNPKSELLFLSVKDFLHTRKWFSRIVLRIGALTAAVVLFVFCLFEKGFLPAHEHDLGCNLAVLVAFGLLVIGGMMNAKQVSYITLRLRSKSQTFWERNGNSIVMIVIGAAVGILGTLVTEYLKHLFR